ncbi:DUF615 domain-containing protein [Parahaliea sp. F7430]|uniref:Dual-action ribosomal maturation protein DarP n=1 Tax=Sediminihaliea albiluteola TaxID=2758564 RepID=A0A7W2YIZ0_9GAMM|nr:ribosome biogenesis factor YjgA [Sediminihaliea albiluteola]MBA6413001.1 DUF615 domain-containing protein [Sediminihaliea albiluteola]
MANDNTLNHSNNDDEVLSKSEMKRRMSALQELGETLAALSAKQLATVPLDDAQLLEAIAEAQNIRSNSARRRHFQYIGKLMRNIDPLPIQEALDKLHNERGKNSQRFQQIEALRDEVLARGVKGIEQVLTQWPNADRQHLRQLVLQHQRELARGKAAAASRKLFRYLRELQENSAH